MARPNPAPTILLAVLILPTLAGCGSSAGYPSLIRRPAELPETAAACGAAPARVTGSAPVIAAAPATSAPTAPPGADLSTRLAALVAEARTAHSRFEAKRTTAEALIRAETSAAPGSDGWVKATLAYAELTAAHAVTSSPLADLDRITVDDRVAHAEADSAEADSTDLTAISAATATVSALIADEAATLAALDSALPH